MQKNVQKYRLGVKKKSFWHSIIIIYAVILSLIPTAHSHDFRHDGGKIYHDLAQEVVDSHNHIDHHAANWPSDNLFTPYVNFADLSQHDHKSNLHAHDQDLLCRVSSIQSIDPPLFHAENFRCLSDIEPRKILNKYLPSTPPSSLAFVSIANNLPPPIV